MATILVNGIPGTKKGVSEGLQKYLKDDKLKFISMGGLLAERGHLLYGTDPDLVAEMDYSYRQILRELAYSDTLNILKASEPKEHIVIDTPLTLYTQGGNIPEVIFPQLKIQALHDVRPLNHIVSLMDVPELVADRLRGQPYPHDSNSISDTNILLDWMIMEGMTGEADAPYDRASYKVQVPHIVVPRDGADLTLAKMIFHYAKREGPVSSAYLAGPITHLKDKQGDSAETLEKKAIDRKRMLDFNNFMQEYIITVIPMTIADGRAADKKQIINTVFRDKHWFVQKTDIVIAYFPDDYPSSGTLEEMRHAGRIGKPVILIHPSLPDKEVFGFRPTMGFKDPESFFKALTRFDPQDPSMRPLKYLFYEGKPAYKGMFWK
jgi:nucleoside 2-deoxyribosyltransferase